MMAKRKGLGRGLDALLAVTEATDDRLQTLPIEAIHAGRYQPRAHIDEQTLLELADSIRSQGVIQPIIVREVGFGAYELIAGERRWRAAKYAGLREVPAVIRVVPDDAALAIALIENIQRKALDPLEEAQGIKRLIDEFGMTHEAAASAVGRSRSAVSNLLRLLSLPEPIQDMVHDYKLEMGHVRALLPLPALEQLTLAQQSVAEGWSVREIERRVQQRVAANTSQAKQTARRQLDPDIARLGEKISDWLGAHVAIQHRASGKGKITIAYSSLDELEGLLAKLAQKHHH